MRSNPSSVFFEKLYAISSAPFISPPYRNLKNFSSFSLLRLFAFSLNPIISRILLALNSSKSCIKFIQIPSHKNIQENEMVDNAAKKTISLPCISYDFSLHFSDIKLYYKSFIFQLWNDIGLFQTTDTFFRIKLIPLK